MTSDPPGVTEAAGFSRQGLALAGDSPWFDGHFPGDPILPGIAQLKLVLELLSDSLQQPVRIGRLSRVKFKKIVRPEDILGIETRPGAGSSQYTFRITCNKEEVCCGVLHLLQQDEAV